MYGSFTEHMQSVVRGYVRDRNVLDLGSGDGGRASILRELGAKSVTEIDYVLDNNARCYSDVPRRSIRPDTVAHIAWPWVDGSDEIAALVRLLTACEIVVYVGKNTDATACSPPEVYAHFTSREVRVYRPDSVNTLIVYGRKLARPRAEVYHEEHLGLHKRQYCRYSPTRGLFRTNDRTAVERWGQPTHPQTWSRTGTGWSGWSLKSGAL